VPDLVAGYSTSTLAGRRDGVWVIYRAPVWTYHHQSSSRENNTAVDVEIMTPILYQAQQASGTTLAIEFTPLMVFGKQQYT